MDVEALRTFLAICREGGFSSAAERLGRSQPAISRRIALLEEELGAPLFERAAGGVTPSEAGHVLRPHAERVVAALEDCRTAIADLKAGRGGRIVLAAVGTLAGAALTPALRRFAAAHPGVDLMLRTATSAEVSDLVRRGEATLGLRYHADPAPDLDCREIARERRQIVCAPEHRFAGRRLASLGALRGERWLAFPNTWRLREAVADSLFAQLLAAGIAEPIWSPVDSLTAQKRLVEAGYGLAVLPEGATEEERAAGALATIEIEGLEMADAIHLATRRDGYQSHAARALIDLLGAALRQGGALREGGSP